MRQRLTIILTFVVIIGLLVIINSLTYIKKDEGRDSEIDPDRSTYHAGPTGTRALHDFLSESGYKVMRWREAPDNLLNKSGELVTTFVVIGPTQLPFTEAQIEVLREWISRGGCFVLIDRYPESELASTAGWTITARLIDFPNLDTDPANATQMTESVTPLAPIQPTALTRDIETVLPSRFASRLTIAPPALESREPEETDAESEAEEVADSMSPAPVVHIADESGALLVDYSYGEGRIILLGDPYLVANGGIRAKDNLQLAINTIAGREGLIAFDEYHQGRGITRNAFASYFSGTPVLAIAGQIILLVLLIVWTNGRRFGRPLPLPQVDRRSSLEFVASMAELQERSRAFDLAIENIYSRTRRVLARYAGVSYNSSRAEIASRIASRAAIDKHQIETLMRQCEEAINGEPIHWRQAIDLVRRLRELEKKLGLRMRQRDIRQAVENI